MRGGHIISTRTPKDKNVIALSLRQAANSIGNQAKHPLAPFFKRIAYRKERNVAITAPARKLALLISNMITKNQPYLQQDAQSLLKKKRTVEKYKTKII